MKNKIQIITIFLGLLSFILLFKSILETETMILSPWFLALIWSIGPLTICLIIGILIKKLFKFSLFALTIPSLLFIIYFGVYKIIEYKPNYIIQIPENYKGEVKLFVSDKNDFLINNQGIGYINEKTFKNGFYPSIMKGNINITEKVEQYNKVTFIPSSMTNHSFEYLSFNVSKPINDENRSIEKLINAGAIDTTRLLRKGK
jgi:hypothetical protein